MNRRPIITIDGPAGAGKSTISRLLASRLGYLYLDTGALYRALAFRLQSAGWDGSPEALAELGPSARISLVGGEGGCRVLVDRQDVSAKIRTEEIGMLASKISAIPAVRQYLLPIQREAAAGGGVVAEGRDMGTVVFPSAEVKFFLDASAAERARRRCLELREKGQPAVLEEIERDLLDRDRRDRNRASAPLAIPVDAIVIDSSDKTIAQVVEIMTAAVGRIRAAAGPCP